MPSLTQFLHHVLYTTVYSLTCDPYHKKLNKMRVWSVMLMVVVVAIASTYAAPSEGGSATFNAVKNWLRPVTEYFSNLPSKTPSDVATDVKDSVTDMRDWVQENEAIQGLMSSLEPARQWIKEKASTIGDRSFQELYQDVKKRVADLDRQVGSFIEQRTSK